MGIPADAESDDEIYASRVLPRRLGQLRIGLAASVFGAAAAIACVLLTRQPHERLLLVIMGVILVASPIRFRLWGRRIAMSPHFGLLFYAWNMGNAVLILTVALLGSAGPGMGVQVWLVTPLLSAAMVCSPRLVGALSAQIVASYVLLETVTQRPGGTSPELFTAVGLALAGGMACASSRYRERQEVRENQLLVNLYELANRDALTGCLSRRALLERLSHTVVAAHRYHWSLAALVIDVDHFKQINDAQGHSAGDEVLQRLATVLAESTRAADLIGRLGGDEFVVVLQEADEAKALLVADKIRARLLAGARPLPVSIGIAILDLRDSMDDLLARADAALYQAKREGRNQSALVR